jgi:catechol 2,3-dioxygenase-like lactoylglutathione lyase family enzyme
MTDPSGPGERRLHHLLLQTSDLGTAEEFYLGFLGFGVKNREPFPDGRPLTVTNEGLGLTDGATALAGTVLEHFAFRARDIRGIAERAARAGVPVVKGPGPGPYGLTVYLADPDGNKVELFADDED